MRDEDDRLSFRIQILENPHHLETGFGIQIPRRLIGENNFRIIDERPCDGDSLFLSTRELIGEILRAVGHIHRSERRSDTRIIILQHLIIIEEWKLHIFKHRRLRQEIERLKHKTDFLIPKYRQLIIVEFTDILPIEEILATRRSVEEPEYLHKRRFPRSRRPHNRNKFTGFNTETHAIQSARLHALIGIDFFQIFDRYQSHFLRITNHQIPRDKQSSIFQIPKRLCI